MEEEILELFQKYKELLSGEVQSEAAVKWLNSQCVRIAQKLRRRGYEVLSKSWFYLEDSAIILWFKLYLVKPDESEFPIAVSFAVLRRLPPKNLEGDSFEAVMARTEAEENEAAKASSSVWRRDWMFKEYEAHAFSAALERHWEALKLESREIVLPGREIILSIVGGGGILAPAGSADIFIFSFLLDRELEYLLALGPGSELPECGCGAEEHLHSLEDWEMRNLL